MSGRVPWAVFAPRLAADLSRLADLEDASGWYVAAERVRQRRHQLLTAIQRGGGVIRHTYSTLADVRAVCEVLTELGVDHLIHEEPRTGLDGETTVVYELRVGVVADPAWWPAMDRCIDVGDSLEGNDPHLLWDRRDGLGLFDRHDRPPVDP